MQKEDIEHLAKLARIALTDVEVEKLKDECTSVLAYVEQVQDIVADTNEEPTVGVHHNILRDDSDPHEPGIYTEKLLDAAPHKREGYISVKKILNDGT